VFGPILERSAKAERIRSVQLLLKRFNGLFSAPQRVTALGAARDYEQVTHTHKHTPYWCFISMPLSCFHPIFSW